MWTKCSAICFNVGCTRSRATFQWRLGFCVGWCWGCVFSPKSIKNCHIWVKTHPEPCFTHCVFLVVKLFLHTWQEITKIIWIMNSKHEPIKSVPSPLHACLWHCSVYSVRVSCMDHWLQNSHEGTQQREAAFLAEIHRGTQNQERPAGGYVKDQFQIFYSEQREELASPEWFSLSCPRLLQSFFALLCSAVSTYNAMFWSGMRILSVSLYEELKTSLKSLNGSHAVSSPECGQLHIGTLPFRSRRFQQGVLRDEDQHVAFAMVNSSHIMAGHGRGETQSAKNFKLKCAR